MRFETNTVVIMRERQIF